MSRNALEGKLLNEYSQVTNTKQKWQRNNKEWLTPSVQHVIEESVLAGMRPKKIAELIGIDFPIIENYILTVRKKHQVYNLGHKEEKDKFTNEIILTFTPTSVLDVFAGVESVYKGKCIDLLSNDIRLDANTDEHMDAGKLLHRLASEGKKFDLVDLDCYGSAYKYLPMACEICKNVLVVTIGDIKMKRFKWENYKEFAKNIYNIDNEDDFNVEGIIKGIQHNAAHFGYRLETYDYRKWRGCGRACFIIK